MIQIECEKDAEGGDVQGMENYIKDAMSNLGDWVRDKVSSIRREAAYRVSEMDRKKLVLKVIPLALAWYIGNQLSWLYSYCVGSNMLIRMVVLFENMGIAFKYPIPSWRKEDLLAGIAAAGILELAIIYRKSTAKKFRKGVEYGSARWGMPSDIRPFMDTENFENNILLTQTERLRVRGRPHHPKYDRNKNVVIVGGSGSGKTRFYAKPNLMQMTDGVSYVFTDPKGTVVLECGRMLVEHGYKLRIFNTINFKKSHHYNPFAYIKCEKDILKLVNIIIANTKGEGEKSSEDFWVKAERLLYCALIGFIWYEAEESEKNFTTLIDMINASEAREDDENFKNPVDMEFDELEKKNPNHFAVRQYKKYKLAAGKTAKSILISCGARLAPFDFEELREIMSYDELELDRLGEEKMVLFVITSDTDSTFDFLTAMCCSQMMNTLCTKADDEHGGKLPVHVRCIFDEFANIKIPDMQRLIAVIRSREISASLILQSLSQLKTNYKDAAETILGNCDTLLFLGGKETSTLKEISELLGKETIDLFNTSDTRGQSPSYGTSYQKTGKELMTKDEIAVMDGGKCILQVRGVRPFLSDKFDITKHKHYGELSDADPENVFSIEEFLDHRLRLKPEEEFELFEVDME